MTRDRFRQLGSQPVQLSSNFCWYCLTSPAIRTYDRSMRSSPDLGEEEAAIAARLRSEGDTFVASLVAMDPGPELAAGLARVSGMLTSPSSQIALYGCWERLSSWTEAQQIAALADAVDAVDPEAPDAWLAADLARTTGLSEKSMATRLAAMDHVRSAMPLAWQALADGRITRTHMWVLGNVTCRATDELSRQVETQVLDEAIRCDWTPAELGDSARRVLLKLDPDGARERADEARKERSNVRLRPEEDMLAALCATGDAWDLRQTMDELNRRADAKKRAGDDRGLGELRVASLTEAVLGASSDPQSNCVDGDVDRDVDGEGDDAAAASVDPDVEQPANTRTLPRRATALVLVPLSTLVGGDEPGHLDGHGAITAEMTRKIAAGDVNFRRLVFDDLTGRPLDLGARSYQLSAEMRRWLEARDRTCRFPGCRSRAVFCDADHAVEWPHGKTTCTNCGLLCRRHHNFKTLKGWKLVRNEDDSVDWESPNGLSWRKEAADYHEFLPLPDPPEEEGHVGDHLTADPDPPDPRTPLPAPPPPRCDCEIEQDDFVRFMHTFAEAS